VESFQRTLVDFDTEARTVRYGKAAVSRIKRVDKQVVAEWVLVVVELEQLRLGRSRASVGIQGHRCEEL